MKKAISLLLTAIMVFGLLPMAVMQDAHAAAELVVTGGSYYYDGREHDVTVEVKDGTGYTIEYSTDGGETWDKESPKLTNSGSIYVKVRAVKGAENLTHEAVKLEVTGNAPAGSIVKVIAADSETKVIARETASSSGKKAGEFNVGETCTLVSQTGKWFKITNGTVTGFIYYTNLKMMSKPGGGGGGGKPDMTKVKLTAKGGTFVYDGSKHSVEATLTDGDGFTIEYSTDGGKTWTTKVPGITEVGSITVKVQATSTAGIATCPDVVLKIVSSIPKGTKVMIQKHGSTTKAPVRELDDSGSKKLGTIDAGTMVTYLGKSGEWVKISHADLEGYVYQWFIDFENLEIKPIITTQPEDTWVIVDTDVVFKVTAKGEGTLGFQWQAYEGGWKNIASGGTSPAFSFKATAARDGKRVRCIVTDSNGSVISKEAKLTVIKTKPVIKKQPASSIQIADGKTLSLTVVADGVESYQWFYMKPGGSWTEMTGSTAKSATLTGTVSVKHDGYKYYCRMWNALGATNSNTITITVVDKAPKITKQPKSITVNDGGTATFSVTASGKGNTYQWFYKKPGGSFVAATNASAKTPTYTGTAAYKHNGYTYKCVVKNVKGKVTSKTVKLTVNPAKPKILTQPTNCTVVEGNTATFSITATGLGLKYKWEYQKPGKTKWYECAGASAKTATYKFTAKAKYDGYAYRVKITTSQGASVYGKIVYLKVN